MEITNYKRNIMGTISFDMKLPKWRKSQQFIVYPMHENPTRILIQSDKRWAEINKDTGEVQMTNGRGGHQNSWLLALQRARGESETYQMSPVLLSELKMQIFTTAGTLVGDSIILSDNSGAFNII